VSGSPARLRTVPHLLPDLQRPRPAARPGHRPFAFLSPGCINLLPNSSSP